MTKAELIDRVAQDAHISKKEAALVHRTLISAIHASLKGKEERIRISGLGTFKVVKRNARPVSILVRDSACKFRQPRLSGSYRFRR